MVFFYVALLGIGLTCQVLGWNTKISARDSNYGTRIDYILITRGLLPWVKAADIQSQTKGSDHCPVYIDLFDEITDPTTGAVVELRRAMGLQGDVKRDPPRLAARFWDEYSGKQTQLHKFFGQKSKGIGSSDTPCPILVSSPSPIIVDDNTTATTTPSSTPIPTTQSSTSGSPTKSSPLPSTSPHHQSSSSQPQPPSSPSPAPISTKRKLVADIRSTSKKQRRKQEEEKKPSQQSIASFFAKPKRKSKDSFPPPTSSSSSSRAKGKQGDLEGDGDVEEDYQFALQLSQLDEPLAPSQSQPKRSKSQGGKGAAEWTNLLAPMQRPKCIVHGEPAKELTVTKQGVNKGKRFFICAR